jgi:YidC/Oxa1 family membrane protein insertase
VFYALYKVLMVSVEMRHQPFFAWMRDLSAPDTASLLTLAHQFGWTWFPPFLGLSILAFLLGVTMWMQFKLNPAQMDPTQQQIFAIMPWVMMFVMAPFASGLQLYWVTSNVLTILQQWWLYKKFGLHLSDTHPVTT